MSLASNHKGSTFGRQSGILMDVHSVSPGSLLCDNSSFPGPGPNEQPVERSRLARLSRQRPAGAEANTPRGRRSFTANPGPPRSKTHRFHRLGWTSGPWALPRHPRGKTLALTATEDRIHKRMAVCAGGFFCLQFEGEASSETPAFRRRILDPPASGILFGSPGLPRENCEIESDQTHDLCSVSRGAGHRVVRRSGRLLMRSKTLLVWLFVLAPFLVHQVAGRAVAQSEATSEAPRISFVDETARSGVRFRSDISKTSEKSPRRMIFTCGQASRICATIRSSSSTPPAAAS